MFDFRKTWYPLAFIYGSITALRNRLYDKGIFKSFEFDIPIICVGNLSFGGTGKTPHIEYLLRILSAAEFSIATLSRGYRRRTQGFLLADTQTDAMKIGDEPMQLYTKFGQQATVAVGENRAFAIPSILAKNEV
ncbi:MAG: tetraacyldisaccharide 4'-kinase [Chitinophagales bacterium]